MATLENRSVLAVLGRILDNSQVAITLCDSQGRLTHFNPAAERLTGYSSAEVLGHDVSMFYPDMKAQQAMLERVLTDGKVEDYEIELVGKSGEPIPISILVTMLHDEDGVPIGTLGISVDQRERRRLEHALRQAKMRADFYNDLMCHDIRNFSQTVMGYLEMLLTSSFGPLTPEQDRVLTICLRQVRRTSTLIERVRLLTRFAEGIPEQTQVQDLGLAAREAIESVLEAYADRDITIRLDAPEICPVQADPLLRELISALVSNGVGHNLSPSPQVWVRVSSPSAQESPAGKANGGFVHLIVEDDGPGIPDHFKQSLFNRFSDQETHGTGIGLSLVKALTERYRGRVWVEDRVAGDPRQGARLLVELRPAGVLP